MTAWVCWFFGVACLPLVAALWAMGRPIGAWGTTAAAVFWLLLGTGSWWFGTRSAAARRDFGAGETAVAVRSHGIAVSPQVVVPFTEIAAVGVEWFDIDPGPTLQVGAKIADSLMSSAMERAGGNVGIAVTAYLHRAEYARATCLAADPGTERLFQRDHAGRQVLVTKVHRLLVDGDFAAFVRALQQAAAYYRVPVTVTSTLPR